jgi:hypothetical protein
MVRKAAAPPCQMLHLKINPTFTSVVLVVLAMLLGACCFYNFFSAHRCEFGS